MNLDIEKVIIEAFVVGRKSERVLHELGSKNKRRKCIWKFAPELFYSEYCRKIDRAFSSPEEIANYLKEYGASRKCYVLSIDERLDGREVEISDALRESYGCGPVLISLIHGRLAYFESETEFGAPQRYLISRVF